MTEGQARPVRYSPLCNEVVCQYGADIGSMARCVERCFYLDQTGEDANA